MSEPRAQQLMRVLAWAQRAITLVALAALFGCTEVHGIPDAGHDGGAIDAGSDSGVEIDATVLADAGDAGPVVHEAFMAFCVRNADLYCAGARDCCSVPDRRRESCSADRIRNYCESLAVDPALRDGTLVWNGAAADAHLIALEEALSTCSAVERDFDLFRSFVDGTLGPGEDCTPFQPFIDSLGRLRCEAGLRCELTGTSTDYAGRCTAPGLAGESCNLDCADGLYCRWREEDMMEPFVGWCEVIDASAPCLTDLMCPSRFCELGVCTEPSAADTWCVLFL